MQNWPAYNPPQSLVVQNRADKSKDKTREKSFLPKGSNKGRGKGEQQPPKRQRVAPAPPRRSEFQAIKRLSIANAKLGLQTARSSRQQHAHGVTTVLQPESACTANIEAEPVDPNDPIATAARKWKALILALIEESELPETTLNVLIGHANACTAMEELFPKFACVVLVLRTRQFIKYS